MANPYEDLERRIAMTLQELDAIEYYNSARHGRVPVYIAKLRALLNGEQAMTRVRAKDV